MTTRILTAGAKPLFLSENYFNRHADKESDLVLAISGSTLRHRLYDMDPEAQWTSAGSDDTTDETIEAGLWLPGMQTSRSIDYIAVMNHNLLELKIETSNTNGPPWTERYNEAAITGEDIRESFAAAFDADRIKFTLKKTQTADQEKLVGHIIVGLSNFQAADRLYDYKPEPPSIGHKTARMADRSIRSAYLYRSDASFEFWAASMAFIVDSAAERARFKALKRAVDPFIVMPRPGDEVDDVYQCRVRPGTFKDPYIVKSTSGGRIISLVAEELGGA